MRMAKTGGVNEYLCLGRRTPATSDLGRRGRTPSSLRQSRCRDPRLRTAYMSASDLADEYDAVMADVIAGAGGCSQADWTTSCINEQRSVGVVFDHIAEGNPDVGRWGQEFLHGRPGERTRETVTQRNAEHARRAAARPRGETVADLKARSASTSAVIRSLTDEQLELTQEFAWAGTKNVDWVASAAILPPQGHLKSIKDAVGR